MPKSLIRRIDARLEALGLTAEGASRQAGLGRDFIRTLRRRQGVSPRSANLAKLANVLGCSVEYLLGRTDVVDPTETVSLPALVLLPIRGQVAAGAWVATDELQDAPIGQREANHVPAYDGFPQHLEEVVGDSYDRLVPPGSFVHVVDAVALGYVPSDGDTVVVERVRAGGSFRERSLKQVQIVPGQGVQLWPRSHNPRWSEPLSLTDGLGDGEDVEVSIAGKVIRAYLNL